MRSGGIEPIADRYLFWDLYGSQAALHGRWKLGGELGNHHGHFDKAVQEAEQGQYELYDLKKDPGETHDVAATEPEIYRDLKRHHIDWLRTAIP